MRSIPFIAALVLALSCTQKPNADSAASTPATASGTVVDLNLLVGEWQEVRDSGRTVVNERWSWSPDGALSGFGFVLSGKDTVFIEHLGILRQDTVTYYAATIGSQNSGPAVLFTLVHDLDSLVFTNPAHDFPQRIVYTPTTSGEWDVSVTGTTGGKVVADHYHFSPRNEVGVESTL